MIIARLILCVIFVNSLLAASWQEQASQIWQDKYASYLEPAFQGTYNYLKSIDPKYLAIGGTLFGLTMLAYIKTKYNTTSPQYLVNKILEAHSPKGPDLHYFIKREKSQEQPGTVWDNKLLPALIFESTEYSSNKIFDKVSISVQKQNAIVRIVLQVADATKYATYMINTGKWYFPKS